jgi:hypothetical protein
VRGTALTTVLIGPQPAACVGGRTDRHVLAHAAISCDLAGVDDH